MRLSVFFFAALLLAGCSGSQTLSEEKEDPDAAAGEQRTVLRGTAMREQSSMGSDLLETLRTANQTQRKQPTAPAKPHFNTLLTALDVAGLADLLQDDGPYTLFAPTDDAFRKLSPDRLEALLDPSHRKQLRRLLRYHLLKGNLVADELAQRSPVATLAESRLTVRGEGAAITVEGARVLQADVGTANGTLHVIDTVLMPPSLR